MKKMRLRTKTLLMQLPCWALVTLIAVFSGALGIILWLCTALAAYGYFRLHKTIGELAAELDQKGKKQ